MRCKTDEEHERMRASDDPAASKRQTARPRGDAASCGLTARIALRSTPRSAVPGGVRHWSLSFVLVLGVFANDATGAEGSYSIRGRVRGADGPVAGARVRVQASPTMTHSDARGEFELLWPSNQTPVTVTACAEGTFVGWAVAIPGGQPVDIVLKEIYESDNVDYEWFSEGGARGTVSCSHCMPAYVDWLKDAHSRSALNPRFLTMYSGTDLQGRLSPPTQFTEDPQGNVLPLPPDPQTPYYGPGFKLDFPDSAGTCAACHLPVAAVGRGGLEAADPVRPSGVAKDGVSCEFCHKVGGVALDAATQLPHPERPGVLSFRLHRPNPGDQLFFGTLDDVTRRVSYSSLEEESAFCAPCHYGVFAGVTVYNSYGEWLASRYSEPVTGRTCQSCHMPPSGSGYIAFPERGGIRRDHARILSHFMPGASSEELLRNAVTVGVEAGVVEGRLRVTVTITNDKTGHHVPTDSPIRHLILRVSARSAAGSVLRQVEGSVLPEWCGVGDPDGGNYAGLPGKVFAKVLQELGTNVTPTAAYWNRTRLISDNRLAADATDVSAYAFVLDPTGAAVVEVSLLFRRAFRPLADLKGWNDPDIVMSTQRVTLDGLVGTAR